MFCLLWEGRPRANCSICRKLRNEINLAIDALGVGIRRWRLEPASFGLQRKKVEHAIKIRALGVLHFKSQAHKTGCDIAQDLIRLSTSYLNLCLAVLKVYHNEKRCKGEGTTSRHVFIEQLHTSDALSHAGYGHTCTGNELVIFW